MFFREQKAKRWTKKQINKNLNVRTPIDCEQYIHSADRTALAALKKIPLLDTVCSKILSFMNDRQVNIINMSSMIHINSDFFTNAFNHNMYFWQLLFGDMNHT